MDAEQFKRWYDKDSGLSEFMQSIQGLDEYSLYIVAKEFLQIILQKHADFSNTSQNDISSKTIAKYNRWYDWNYDLHTCVEYLKDITPEERNELIQEFKNICIQHLSDYYAQESVELKNDDEKDL